MVETVQHQLFECINASRLWFSLNRFIDKPVNNFSDIVLCNRDAVTEIAKSVILKALIQIDRSKHRSIDSILFEIKNQLLQESMVMGNRLTTKKAIDVFIERLNSVN